MFSSVVNTGAQIIVLGPYSFLTLGSTFLQGGLFSGPCSGQTAASYLSSISSNIQVQGKNEKKTVIYWRSRFIYPTFSFSFHSTNRTFFWGRLALSKHPLPILLLLRKIGPELTSAPILYVESLPQHGLISTYRHTPGIRTGKLWAIEVECKNSTGMPLGQPLIQ